MKRFLFFPGLIALILVCAPARSQTANSVVVATCGTPPTTYVAGYAYADTQNTSGQKCTSAAGGGSSNATIVAPLGSQAAATSVATVLNPTAAQAHNFPGCTVGVTSAQCLATATATDFIQVQNTSVSASIACAWGATAVLNSAGSFQLAAGQSASWGPNTRSVPTGALNCIASGASTPLYLEWH